ncbi:hypothetical protein ES705_46743 [subsurface metagenome]
MIGTDPVFYSSFWWPWVKNYYGERHATDIQLATYMAHAWLDQNLKAEMGY